MSICLNMIVKNEAHVITDTLINLCNYINFSYYVISDTGSTDGTQKIIEDFFNAKNIKGEIYNDEWKDFGYNRTLALKYAYNKSKYILIFDADDRIIGDFKLPSILNFESYYFKFGSGVTYKRILMVDNTLEWSFIGVLHEYINCITKKDFNCSFIDGDYHIESGKTGSRSNDPDKYKKDAIVLQNAFYEAEKNNEYIKIRYAFYCAQSYRDSNDIENAIYWYKKRTELKDWEQEVYFSYYMIGKLYYDLNETEKAIYYWSLCHEIDKERYEGIYELMTHFRKNGNSYLAYKYYNMIENDIPDLNNKLFAYYPIYNYLLEFEISIIYYNIKKYDESIKHFKKLISRNNLPIIIKINIFDNFIICHDNLKFDLVLYEYYFDLIKSLYLEIKHIPQNTLDNIKKTVDKFISLYNTQYIDSIKKTLNNRKKVNVLLSITSCKRYDLFYKTIDSILTCWKDINLVDFFFCVDDNSSHEDKTKMLKNYPFFKFYFKKNKEKGHLKSMNIIWDKLNELKPKYWIHLEDDWLFIKPCNYVQKSIDFLQKYKDQNIHQILFNKNYGETIDNYNLVGGNILSNDYLLHVKDEQNLKGPNCAYWAHYSFRPSMILTKTILKLGNYNSPNSFFEQDYAYKYFNSGYKSAFYNEITCLHTGKLTSEKVSDKKNAYALNNISQFNKKNKIGFYSQNFDHGISEIIYMYAKYNEFILNNDSFIFLPKNIDNNLKNIFIDINIIDYDSIEEVQTYIQTICLNHIFIFKNTNNKTFFNNCINIIHENSENPENTENSLDISLYNTRLPIIEPIIEKNISNKSYREIYNISDDSIVYGIYGDKTLLTFDYFNDTILKVLNNKNIYFFIYNFPNIFNHDRIIYLNDSFDKNTFDKNTFDKNTFDKNSFINTCNYILYGLIDNMFNIDYFKFASNNKKIICKFDNYESHILKDNFILYNKDSLFDILSNINNYDNTKIVYDFTPETIMIKFKNILKKSEFNTIYFNKVNNNLNKNYTYCEKVNDKTLKSNSFINTVFSNNNFKNNKKIIYDILTHIESWKKILDSKFNYFIILEYDIEMNIIDKISNETIDYDITILKHTFVDKTQEINQEINFVNINKDEVINSKIYGYIIKKSCIQHIMKHIYMNYINEEFLINLFLNINDISIGITQNFVLNLNKNIIDNIENNYNEIIDINIINNDKYLYIHDYDHFYDDIYFKNNITLTEFKTICELNENCIAFNTLGYFKNSVNMNTLRKLDFSNNGIYIHIEKYNKKYNRNLLNDINNINEIKYSINSISESVPESVPDSEYDPEFIEDKNIKKYIFENYNNYNFNAPFIKIINNYIFIENYDSLESLDDIYYKDFKVNDMMKYAIDNDIKAFNTFGYFKKDININNIHKKYDDKNGIFIHISVFSEYKYFKIDNINTLDIEYKPLINNFDELINIISNTDQYIGFNSNGYLKKTIDLKNIINLPKIYNNYLCINMFNYYNYINKNNKNIRVKVICNWIDSYNLCKYINKMSKGKLLWNNIEFTYDDNLIDYYIIFEGLFNDTYYIPEKTIFFGNNELNINFMKFSINNDLKYFFWKTNMTYIELKYHKILKKFDKLLINSNVIKLLSPNLLNYINISDDIYDKNLIFNYKYVIIIEDENNNILHDIFNSILSECLCFYHGSENIYNYISNDSIIKIDINNKNDTYNIINDAINNNLWEKKIEYIKIDKNKILDNYNIFPFIEKIINKI